VELQHNALIWFCSFRGEYLNAKACDVRRTYTGRKVMARVHMTRRANKISYWFFYLFNNINVNSYEPKKSKRYYKVYSRLLRMNKCGYYNNSKDFWKIIIYPIFDFSPLCISISREDFNACF
jgi:hypothetical protein